jgi:hypothetical protein
LIFQLQIKLNTNNANGKQGSDRLLGPPVALPPYKDRDEDWQKPVLVPVSGVGQKSGIIERF